jgi:ribosomal protein S18 acetylase RimI-like enzyme
MGAQFTTRPFVISDYEAAVELWSRVEGVEIAEGDSKEDIEYYLSRNPNFSRVAEQDGRVVGVVLCGEDGHRGFIYHAAVAPEYQQKGVARQLVKECVDGLRGRGLKRALILVAGDNPGGQAFWESCGCEEVPGAKLMGIDLW